MSTLLRLREYDSCTFWFEGIKSKSTLDAYTIHLSLFCKFHNVNPDELIQLNNSAGQLKTMILNYIIHLKKIAKHSAGKPRKGELSVNSIKLYLKGVKSFLEFNEIPLPWKKIAKFHPDDVTNSYRSYTKDEIKKLLSVADPRDRCIILLMASSGIRVGAIQTLKVRSIKRLDNEVGVVTVYPESKDSVYVALVTPEFLSSFDEYLKYRKSQGEKITTESWLIRDKFATFSKKTNKPIPPSVKSINKQMRFLLRKAGLPFEELQPDHSLRKFFNTALMNSDVPYTFKELLMGHSMKLDNVYYDKENEKSQQKILLEYMKAIDALTINDEYRLRKQIVEFEEKVKDVPKVEQLESHLANKILEQEAIKKQLEKLRTDKEKETQTTQQKYEQDMKAMREDMNQQFSQIMSMIHQNPKLAQIKPEALVNKIVD
ncbi:MAG: site-specific integrase [Thermoproteota archaeon]|nr:site-specific integrase [Thermoproteota archaeon]